MSQERLSMRKIIEILRLKHVRKLSNRKIARSCGVSKSTVANYIARAEKAGLSWPLPQGMTESQVHQYLFPSLKNEQSNQASMPNWELVHQEMQTV